MFTPSSWMEHWQQFLLSHPSLQLPFANYELPSPSASPEVVATDEDFWRQVQALFPKPSGHINLNNGGVCSNMLYVEKAYTHYYSLLNSSPSYFTWKVMEHGRTLVKEGLATMLHCDADEIALFRNASEALNNAIFGIPLQAGDEVVACHQDYIKCVSSWKQREMREGIRINWVTIDGTESDEEVITKYRAAITPKTKVMHVTHVINWNGHILPAQQLLHEAKKRQLITVLDAAHSFAVLPLPLDELDCDYMGAALHKWLSGPIAAGCLFIRREQIAATWPLASAVEPRSNSIQKMEEMSIQVMPNLMGLGFAIEFHFRLSLPLIQARLRYLRQTWTDALQAIPSVSFRTPLDEPHCLAIANFNIEGIEPLALEQILYDEFGIHTVGFIWPNLSGVRITPNIYTPIEDIHQLVKAVQTITAKK